jgi:cytochrome c5
MLLVGPLAGWAADASKYPQFDDPRLKHGRTVWLGTCEACHAHDLAGAPLVHDKKAWKPRLAKGTPALYASAVGGLTGPKGTQMPPARRQQQAHRRRGQSRGRLHDRIVK